MLKLSFVPVILPRKAADRTDLLHKAFSGAEVCEKPDSYVRFLCSLQLIKQCVFGCRQDEEHCIRNGIVSFSLTLYETVKWKSSSLKKTKKTKPTKYHKFH